MTIPGIYSQRDPRWANFELGYNDDPYYNLYHFGCLITGVANMLWWNGNQQANPASVNEWLRANNGFLAGGGNLIWGAIKPLLDQVGMVERGYTSDLAATNAFLADDNAFAIAWITKPGFPMHFSAMPYVNMIADSWDAQLKPVTTYTFHGAHLYSKAAPVVLAPPTSAGAVAAPTIAAPMEPTPEPVVSQLEPVPEPTPPIVIPSPEPETAPGTIFHPDPDTGNGQPSGDVSVNVLEDLPEFEATFKPFKDGVREIHLKADTVAIDASGVGVPKQVLASIPLRSSGTFTENGRKYYRGTSGGWYAVSAEDVVEEGELAPVPAVRPNWFTDFIRDPVGALIRLIARIHS